MISEPRVAARGVTLVETLVSLLVISFGLLALAGMQIQLARHADTSRERVEATRLAEQMLEQLRGDAHGADTSETPLSDGGADRPTLVGLTAFERNWTLGGAAGDAQRVASVSVSWTDRASAAADSQVTLKTVIARSYAVDGASLTLPVADPVRKARRRHGDIPFSACRLGGANRGKSVIEWTGADHGYLVFDDSSGAIVAQCASRPDDRTALHAECTALDAVLIEGYITSADAPSAGALRFESNTPASAPMASACAIDPAVDDRSGARIGGVYRYRCKLNRRRDEWAGGHLLFAGLAAGSIVCAYAGAPDSAASPSYTRATNLPNHPNFVLAPQGSCPADTERYDTG